MLQFALLLGLGLLKLDLRELLISLLLQGGLLLRLLLVDRLALVDSDSFLAFVRRALDRLCRAASLVQNDGLVMGPSDDRKVKLRDRLSMLRVSLFHEDALRESLALLGHLR